jgi:error-prone DNA polymerase
MSDYVELRTMSAFSFLYGASTPEDLVTRAAELGYDAVALGDREGLYGAPRFYKEARARGLRALCAADLTLEGGGRLYLLVKDRAGYQNLCRLITEAKAGRKKGDSAVPLDRLEAHAAGLVAFTDGEDARLLDRLRALYPRDLYLEVGRHLDAGEERRTSRVVDRARALGLPLVATNDVRHARARGVDLSDVLTCLREKVTLDEAGRRLARNAEHHLKSPAEMARLFGDLPDAVKNSRAVAERLAFTLADLGYRFPDYPVPAGETAASYLAQLTHLGARDRYRPVTPKVAAQLARELQLITKLELEGYFLIVWDIVEYCRRHGILAQGRGSAANSAVCYALGITAVDPVGMELLFERFLSEERLGPRPKDGAGSAASYQNWPDIDLDLPSGDRREQVIQYVYQRYGGRAAAMTANCITYRARLAVREVGKVLGLPEPRLDRLAKQLTPFEYRTSEDELAPHLAASGLDPEDRRVRLFARLVTEIEGLPRHLGQHSGGMVLCAGRLDEIVPLEPAAMPGRVVVQWDKDDCADLGIIKVDLLGLGMMAVLEEAVPLVRAHEGQEVDLAHLPPDDPATYAMLRAADTVGVFQVESRAQMATLPRIEPRCFYDLVVEVAIIRPGPIVGQMVHPYIRRRRGREPVSYPHPSLEPILRRTLGVPLFQEQLMRLAMVAAGFSGGEAEELRRAMGAKRSKERMDALEARLREGMRQRGITGAAADQIVLGIRSFALYGFPESHAASFALLVYASAYLKAHHPAAFLCALLNQWPMGFYHPATLITDARRHGVRVLPICAARSGWRCTLEPVPGQAQPAVRLGLRYVAGLREAAAERLVAARAARPFASVADLERRSGLQGGELETLAALGALNAFGHTRRSALWQAAALDRSGRLFLGVAVPDEGAPPLADMTLVERLSADYRASGVTTGPHPMGLLRERLARAGVVRASDLARLAGGRRVEVAGTVIVRQRPGSAKGFFFLTLEDETGFANGIVTPQVFAQHRAILTTAPALVIGGVLQRQDGVVSVKADRFRAVDELDRAPPSRDFH